jgi:hypothetical protein
MENYKFDKEEDKYLVRSTNITEQDGWWYCIGCEKQNTNWREWVELTGGKKYFHHVNCPRGKED